MSGSLYSQYHFAYLLLLFTLRTSQVSLDPHLESPSLLSSSLHSFKRAKTATEKTTVNHTPKSPFTRSGSNTKGICIIFPIQQKVVLSQLLMSSQQHLTANSLTANKSSEIQTVCSNLSLQKSICLSVAYLLGVNRIGKYLCQYLFNMLRTKDYSSTTATIQINYIKAWDFPPIIIVPFLIIPARTSVKKFTLCGDWNSGDSMEAIRMVQMKA